MANVLSVVARACFCAILIILPLRTGASTKRFNVEFQVLDYDQYQSVEEVVDELTLVLVEEMAADEENIETGTLVIGENGFELSSVLIIEIFGAPDEFLVETQAQLRRIYLEGKPWKGKRYHLAYGRIGFTSNAARSLELVKVIHDSARSVGLDDHKDVCDTWLTKAN